MQKTILILSLSILINNAMARSKVMFIGDSHSVETFGQTLTERLRAHPNVYNYSIASCGSRPGTWLEPQDTTCGFFASVGQFRKRVPYQTRHYTPDIAMELNAFYPKLVIVALGYNDIHMPINDARLHTRKLINLIKSINAKCIWVGPPLGKRPLDNPEKFQALLQMHQEEIASKGCNYLDSRPYTHMNQYTGDGIHFDQMGNEGRELARNWAHAIYALINPVLNQL